MIKESHDHKVSISFSAEQELDSMLKFYRSLIEWLDEITEWQGSYSIIVYVGHIDVWFENQEHAVLCIIKWI